MKVHQVMTPGVYALGPDTSLDTAARLLASRHITGAPVVSEVGTPIGVITLADLVDPDRPRSRDDGYPRFYRVTGDLVEELGDGVCVVPGRVCDVMSPFVLAIEAQAPLVVAAQRMLEECVHRLLVMEQTRLIGIVTSTDLLRGFVQERR